LSIDDRLDVLVYGERAIKKKEGFFEDENLIRSWKKKVILKDKEKWKKDRHKSR